jgi:type I restriction enzyme M protein
MSKQKSTTPNASGIVSKVWAFCQTLRDDGVGYGDYLEQLTYLLFLKMADEYSKPPHNRKMPIPKKFGWETLTNKSGSELELHYNILLRELAKEKGILGQIFIKSQNKIQDPAKLYKLIALINAENWILMGVKDKGDIYEGLLEKNAEDTKSGAGQYFTPRALIKTMVECLRPEPKKTIADPACGTGGFFLAAYDFISDEKNYSLDKDQKKFFRQRNCCKHKKISVNEFVSSQYWRY